MTAASNCQKLFLPPPPVGVGAPPVGVALLVLADQDAEPDTGASVALVAQLMETDYLGLDIALRPSGRWNRCRGG